MNDSRIRILFVIGTMGGGGAERQLIEILRRLDRSRFQPFLYLALKTGELLGEVPEDVPIFAYWDGSRETPIGRILRLLKLTRLLRQIHLASLLRKQKIELIYDRTYLATLAAAAGCLLRPTPRISCVVADPESELAMHAKISRTLSWWVARRAYRSANVVLANSEGLRRRFLQYFRLPSDHVKVFYNLLADVRRSAVPNNDSRASEETSRQAIDAWLDGSYLIVYTGRLHEQKGPHVLVKAIEELVNRRGRRLQLLMLGNGPAEQEIREFITAHRLEANIRLMGFVEDPRTWYQRAQLFVMPSYFEGMPNALIEAVAAGLPAVSSNCHSGPGEILDEGRCGRLVQPGDPIALADGIADAMDHPDDCKTKADAARARVLQMFDPVEGMRRLEELFVSIVQGSTKKPPQAVR